MAPLALAAARPRSQSVPAREPSSAGAAAPVGSPGASGVDSTTAGSLGGAAAANGGAASRSATAVLSSASVGGAPVEFFRWRRRRLMRLVTIVPLRQRCSFAGMFGRLRRPPRRPRRRRRRSPSRCGSLRLLEPFSPASSASSSADNSPISPAACSPCRLGHRSSWHGAGCGCALRRHCVRGVAVGAGGVRRLPHARRQLPPLTPRPRSRPRRRILLLPTPPHLRDRRPPRAGRRLLRSARPALWPLPACAPAHRDRWRTPAAPRWSRSALMVMVMTNRSSSARRCARFWLST